MENSRSCRKMNTGAASSFYSSDCLLALTMQTTEKMTQQIVMCGPCNYLRSQLLSAVACPAASCWGEQGARVENRDSIPCACSGHSTEPDRIQEAFGQCSQTYCVSLDGPLYSQEKGLQFLPNYCILWFCFYIVLYMKCFQLWTVLIIYFW